MHGVVDISAPGVSGPQHLLIPESCLARSPYETSTDVSLTLPPLTLNAIERYCSKTNGNTQWFATSGIPSPPSSDSSQNYTSQERSAVAHDSTVSLPVGHQKTPYSLPGSWTSPMSYATASSQNMTEPPAYDMSFASLAIRPGSQRQLQQQQNFYAPQYGGPVMPAPSSLLGPQIAQAPNHTPPRGTLTYQPLLPPIAPGAHDYAPTAYGHNVQLSAGVPFLPAPGAFTWQSSFYSQPYIQSRVWEQQSLISRSTRPTTILGTLPREAWERVFQYLDYADRLRLQSVNKFWAESLKALDKRIKENPSDADFADMHSLVLQAENYRKHWAPSMAAECKTHRGRPRNGARNARTPPDATEEEEESKGRRASMGSIGKLGCYHCFTVRPPDKFCLKTDEDDANIHGSNEDNDHQPKNVGTGPAPRRYCLDCGIKKGYHPPNKYLERKWGIEVWICCGAYYDHGVMNCPTCKRGCPLTPVTKTSRNSGKRSSPMPPPPSRPRKQQRTAVIDPLGQGRSIGYPQQYLQDHNPQSWC